MLAFLSTKGVKPPLEKKFPKRFVRKNYKNFPIGNSVKRRVRRI